LDLGEAFFLNVDPGEVRHLWVVIARAADDAAIVNFTTRTPSSPDESCIVAAGEHPFVVHDTVVNYAAGKLIGHAELEGARAHRLLEVHPDRVSPELLLRIQEAALASPYTARKVKAAVRRTLGT
jgi:hypothetical protein